MKQTDHDALDAALQRLRDQNLSLLVEHCGEVIFRSSESGLRPLLQCIAENRTRTLHATVTDKVVGAAAAKLMICGGVGAVFTGCASERAVEVLTQAKITITAKVIVPVILNRERRDACPMEKLAAEFEKPADFLEELLRRFGEE